MKKLQVLVATMKQDDFSLVEKMNIKCDAVIANQYDKDSIVSTQTEFGEIKMITTAMRGVGLNRNIALNAADAELLLFADDDMYYYDGTLEGVKKAFEELPNADVIIFSVDIVKNNKIVEKRYSPIKRRHIWNALKYGTCVIAIRKSSYAKANLSFHTFFGGGCIYGSGEDSLFIIDCLKKGLHIYTHPYVLGKCNKDTSSWFEGFNKKYFFDKGAFYKLAFGKCYLPVVLYLAYSMKKRGMTELGFADMVSMMIKGTKYLKHQISYSDYVEQLKKDEKEDI